MQPQLLLKQVYLILFTSGRTEQSAIIPLTATSCYYFYILAFVVMPLMVLTWVLLCVFWHLHSDKDSSPDLTERQGRGHVQGDYWLHTVRSLGRERSFRCALKSQARWPCQPPSPGASCSARGRRRSSRGRRAALWSSLLSLALHKASTSWESGRWCWPGWNSSAAASPSRVICCFDL